MECYHEQRELRFIMNDNFLLDYRLTDIFELTSNFVLFIDIRGKIAFGNVSFCKYTGFSREEIKMHFFRELLSPEFQKFFDGTVKQNLFNGINWKGELEHLRKDGTRYWTTSSFTKLLGDNADHFGFFVIEDDITPIKEVANQLEYRANLLYEDKLKIETILNNLPFSVVVLEKDGTILYKNELFQNAFKEEFDRILLINSNIKSYLPNIFIETIIKMVNIGEKDEIIVKLDSEIYLQINVIPLDYLGQKAIFIVVIRDITNSVEFDLLQKQFVTTVSHELRTPIASVLLSINNYIKYKEKLSDDQNSNLLRIIQQNANVLKGIVENLLIISHIDNRKLKLRNWTKFNVFREINQVILQLRPQIDLKNIEINFNCQKDLILFSDVERFSQIIRIPLENAIKYSETGKDIIISVKNTYEGEYNTDSQNGLLIQIEDYGLGIKSSEQKYLFKRFFRGSNVQNLQGTGIGLSILKELVNLVDGKIFIESTEGTGTKVNLFLPLLVNPPT